MRTPAATLRARGIDPHFTHLFRDRAQESLRSARQAAWRAECCFDNAAQELRDGGPFAKVSAEQWLDLAFRWIETARFDRLQAKAHALMAVRGTPIEYWTAERRRGNRLELEARRARLACTI